MAEVKDKVINVQTFKSIYDYIVSLINNVKTTVSELSTTISNHISNKSNPHEVSCSQINAVPTSRTINGKMLSSDITLTASDVGANYSAGNGLVLNNSTFEVKLPLITARCLNNDSITTSDTLTLIPLTACQSRSSEYFTLLDDGRIQVARSGLYFVSGSVYFETGTHGSYFGCYVRNDTKDEELASQWICGTGYGSVSSGSVIVALQDEDIIGLYARSKETASVYRNKNTDHITARTKLDIFRLQLLG